MNKNNDNSMIDMSHLPQPIKKGKLFLIREEDVEDFVFNIGTVSEFALSTPQRNLGMGFLYARVAGVNAAPNMQKIAPGLFQMINSKNFRESFPAHSLGFYCEGRGTDDVLI